MTRVEKVAHWREVVAAQVGSGFSVAGFCRERELEPWQFYYWRRRLQELDAEAGADEGFVEVGCAGDEPVPSSSSGVRICRGGFAVVVEREFDHETLRRVLAVLPC